MAASRSKKARIEQANTDIARNQRRIANAFEKVPTYDAQIQSRIEQLAEMTEPDKISVAAGSLADLTRTRRYAVRAAERSAQLIPRLEQALVDAHEPTVNWRKKVFTYCEDHAVEIKDWSDTIDVSWPVGTTVSNQESTKGQPSCFNHKVVYVSRGAGMKNKAWKKVYDVLGTVKPRTCECERCTAWQHRLEADGPLLVKAGSRVRVGVGDTVYVDSLNGQPRERYKVKSIEKPHSPAASGRLTAARFPYHYAEDQDTEESTFYVGVFGCEFVGRKDRS